MGDGISIIESSYHSGGDGEAWLGRICQEIHGATGAIVFGNFVDAANLGRIRYWAEVSAGLDGKSPLPSMARKLNARATRALFGAAPRIETISERLSRAGIDHRPLMRPLHRFGVRDLIGLMSMGPDGRGWGVGVALPPERRIGANERRRWEKIAAHIAAGNRLRRNLMKSLAPEAVLRPDGRVEHAEG